MDLLASLGLGTALPEQSTRLLSHPGIEKVLLLEKNTTTTTEDEEDGGGGGVRLGFTHCVTCGMDLFSKKKRTKTTIKYCKKRKDDMKNSCNLRNKHTVEDIMENDTTATEDEEEENVDYNIGVISCQGCHRVKYCSKACLIEDSKPLVVTYNNHINNNNHIIRGKDGCTTSMNDEDGDGHSPIICSLLRLCNEDDNAEEEEELLEMAATTRTNEEEEEKVVAMHKKKKKYILSKNEDGGSTSSSRTKEAAVYRIQTERESYPATLFNILSEGPDWFVESITRRLRCNVDVRSPINNNNKREGGKILYSRAQSQPPPPQHQRRGKRERSSVSPIGVATTKRGREKEIVLHIVGASTYSELWGWDMMSSTHRRHSRGNDEEDDVSVLNAYAEASTNLSSYLKNLLEMSSVTIRCVFIGPDCPTAGKEKKSSSSSAPAAADHYFIEVPIPDESSSTLIMETYRCKYGGDDQPYLPYPDVIVFFNPGFSCPDYDWSVALSAAMAYQYSSSISGSSYYGAIPFLITTNTEMEGLADMKYLLDGGYVDKKSLPQDLLYMIDQPQATNGEVGHADINNEYEDENYCVTSFFGENPYAGLRVRQSGTMANDLFVKNRWIIGGLFHMISGACHGWVTRTGDDQNAQSRSRKRKIGRFSTDQNNEDSEDEGGSREIKARKMHHRAEGQRRPTDGANEKRKNPALI